MLGLAPLGIGIAALAFLLRSNEIGATLFSLWLIPLHLLLVLLVVLEVQEAWLLWRWSRDLSEVSGGMGRRAVEICTNLARESIGTSTSETRWAIETLGHSLIEHLGVRYGRYIALGFASLGLIMGVYFVQFALAPPDSGTDHFNLFLGVAVIYSAVTVLFAILLSYWGRTLVLNWSYLACGLTQLPYDFNSIQPELSSFVDGDESIIQAEVGYDSAEGSAEDVNWDDVGGSSIPREDGASEELEGQSSWEEQQSDQYPQSVAGGITEEDEEFITSEPQEDQADSSELQSSDDSSKKDFYRFETVEDDMEDDEDEWDI